MSTTTTTEFLRKGSMLSLRSTASSFLYYAVCAVSCGVHNIGTYLRMYISRYYYLGSRCGMSMFIVPNFKQKWRWGFYLNKMIKIYAYRCT